MLRHSPLATVGTWTLRLILVLTAVLTTVAHGETAFPPPAEMHDQLPKLGDSGNAKLDQKDLPGAVADFTKGFEYSKELGRLYAGDPTYEPVYVEECYFFLERLGLTYSQMGELEKALYVTEQATAGYEGIAAEKRTPETKATASDMLGRLAWLQLKLNKPAEAEKSAQKGLDLDPSLAWLRMNLAHAMLLQGKIDDATSIYKEHRNADIGDGRIFDKVVLDDFAELEAAGVRSPEFNKIRLLYGVQNLAETMPKPATDHAAAAQREAEHDANVETFKSRKLKTNIIIWSSIVLVIAAIFGLAYYFDGKRTKAIQAFAESWGWTFRPKAAPADLSSIIGSQLNTRGNSRAMTRVIDLLPEGSSEQVRLFEFTYTQGHGKSKQTYQQTVAHYVSPKVATLPPFVLKPESIFDKLASAFGSKDIDLPEHPAFSKRYLLKGADEAAIRQFFTPDIVAFFEKEKRWVVEVFNNNLFLYQENFRPKPKDLQTFLGTRNALFELLTREVA